MISRATTRDTQLGSATAAMYPVRRSLKSSRCHLSGSSLHQAVRKSAAGVPGASVTSKLSRARLSPSPRALMKAYEGDVVELRTPSGIEPIEVIEIRYRDDAAG